MTRSREYQSMARLRPSHPGHKNGMAGHWSATLAALLSALAMLLVAGCGGAAPATSIAAPTSVAASVLQLLPVTMPAGPQTVLASGAGRVLYLFTTDVPGTPTCTGSCAATWPPFTAAEAPSAGNGVTAALIGSAQRPDGSAQITYNGHPLYFYSGDRRAGEATGHGSGGVWFAVTAAGAAAPAATGSTPATPAAADTGYDY